MSINQNDLLSEFNENVKFDYNLKKRNWFNIGVMQKFSIKLKI
jgi:UDP-N-acetylmuramate dehydrogenase